jgi:hypothetical protein
MAVGQARLLYNEWTPAVLLVLHKRVLTAIGIT